jgi:acetoin utilization protein AcuB
MEIRKWMKHPVHTVKPLDSIQHARELMESHRVNQLPVVVDGRLVGIITDRDLRDAFPSVFDSSVFGRRKPRVTATDPKTVTVEAVMTPNVITAGSGDSMADAVRLMRRQRIGALPVVEKDRIVGIVTRSDVLDAFVDLVGAEDLREAGLFVAESGAEVKPSAAAAAKRPAARRSR